MATYTISKITDPNGNVFNLKDSTARSLIDNLDVSSIGGDGYFIKWVSQTDGKISAGKQAFATSISGSESVQDTAPTVHAVATYVNSIVSSAIKFDFKIVTELPTAAETTRSSIYLIKHSHSDTGDSYDEYVTIRTGSGTATDPYAYTWEKIGNTDVDLSDYIKGVNSTFNGTASSHSHTATFTGTAGFHGHNASFTGTAVTPTTKSTSFTGTKATISHTASFTGNKATVTGATGSFTGSEGTISTTATFSGSTATITPTASVTGTSYTPKGTISISDPYTPSGIVKVTGASYTPSGTVSISGSQQSAIISMALDANDSENLIFGATNVVGSISSATFSGAAATITPTASFTGKAKDTTPTATFSGTAATITPTVKINGASYTPSGTVAVADASFTPSGSVTVDDFSFTPSGTVAVADASFTPTGSVSVTMNSITPAGSVSVAGTDFTPKGTVSISSTSVTPSGTITNTYTH